MSKSSSHILVIRLSAMGDVAMVVPVLQALARQYPELKLSVLTRPFFTPFFRDLPTVTVIPIDVKRRHKGLWGLYKLAQELKKTNPHAIADLHKSLRTRVLHFFLRKTQFATIDKGRKEKRLLTQGQLFRALPTTHQRYATVFELLGYPIDLTNPQFPSKAPLNPIIKKHLQDYSKPWVGIAPFAAHAGKMYPLDLMTQVIKILTKKCTIILFGSNAEAEALDTIAEKIPKTVNIAGKLSLDSELDLISNLNLMVSMDSSNAHIAAMLGQKVLTIWGVTHPFAGFAPFNQPAENALLADRQKYPEIPTSVYGNVYPKSYKNAAGSIAPEIVAEKIKSLL